MKEQLESLANEMISEVKNLKDLTKENLPLIAQEYVKYGQIISLVNTVQAVVVSMLGVYFGLYLKDTPTISNLILGILGVGFCLFGALTASAHFDEYLSFKLKPRSKAIQGVIKAFKGRD